MNTDGPGVLHDDAMLCLFGITTDRGVFVGTGAIVWVGGGREGGKGRCSACWGGVGSRMSVVVGIGKTIGGGVVLLKAAVRWGGAVGMGWPHPPTPSTAPPPPPRLGGTPAFTLSQALEMANGSPPHAALPPFRAVFMITDADPLGPEGPLNTGSHSPEFRDFVQCCLQRSVLPQGLCAGALGTGA